MALPLSNDAEGGTSGTTVSAANSGGASGDAFNTVTLSTGAALTFDNGQAAHGGLAYKFVLSTTTGTRLIWTSASVSGLTTADSIYVRIYYYLLTANTALNYFTIVVRSGTVSQAFIGMSSGASPKLRVRGSATSPATNSVNNFPTGQWVRIDVKIDPPSTTAGVVTASMYYGANLEAAAGTAPAGDTAQATAVNTGAAAYSEVRVSEDNNTSVTFYVDDIAVASTGHPGPVGGGGGGATPYQRKTLMGVGR